MRKMSLLLSALAILPLTSQAQEAAKIQVQEATTSQAFRVDSDASWLRVLAYPDGPLKRFGHHHVISHHGISGTVEVAQDPLESTFMLEIAVSDLAVDDADVRALEGEDFQDEVPQKDIDGTRANMLGEKLLNAEQFPTIQVQSSAIEGSMPAVTIVATVTVTGIESSVAFPATIELTDGGAKRPRSTGLQIRNIRGT
jgi:polyisoprenoid-binding protein YceI